MVRISVHKFRGEDKKGSSALNLRLRLGLHSYFLSWNETLLTLGGARAVFWGGTSPEMHSSGTGPVTFVWGTILAWGHIFCLGGTFLPGGAQAVIWGAPPRNGPNGDWPGLNHNNISSTNFMSPFFVLKSLYNLDFFKLLLLLPFMICEVFVFPAPYFFASSLFGNMSLTIFEN